MKTAQVPYRDFCVYANCSLDATPITEVNHAPDTPDLNAAELDQIHQALRDYRGRAAFGVPLELLAHVLRSVPR